MIASLISCVRRVTFAALCSAFVVSTSAYAIPAFPGAEGFGTDAIGGRGGSVYIVTNLNDSGAGSFRDAVSQPNRTVVFAVGGVINLTSGRVSVKSNITIAGQTAPGEGITIYGNGVSFTDANNTICRYIRFRQGINGDSGTDAVGIASGNMMIFDHVSASWGRDETFSVSGSPSNITLQDCVIAQGLLIHSAGGLMQTDGGVSVFRSLYADNWMRNPKVKGKHEFTNNLVYNWGSGGGYIAGDSAGQSYTNIVGNYFSAGPNTGSTPAFIRGNLNFHTYAAGNFEDANKNGVADAVAVHPLDQTPVDPQAARYDYPAVARLLSAQQAFDYVLANAGASLHRDSVDQYVVNEVLSHGTVGAHIGSEAEVGGVGTVAGGLAPTDTDSDGMPDSWEQAAGTNAAVADNNGDVDGDGYTNLENYLNAIAPGGVQGARIVGLVNDTGVVNNDGNTSDNAISLVGTAVPNSTVTVRRLGVGMIGSVVADAAGNWAFDYSATTLADGYYVFTASATYAGLETPPSRAFLARIDTTAAVAPAISSLVTSPAYAFNGTAEPNVAISVTLVGTGTVATGTADAFGNWTAAYSGPALAPGVYSFTAAAVDVAGNAGPESAAYVVDTSLAAPTFTGIQSDSGTVGDQITNDQTLVLNGTAAAGSTVTITRVGSGSIGTAAASGTGTWSFNYAGTTLPAGIYTFTATATAGAASSPQSAPFVVNVDRTAPTLPSILRQSPTTASTTSSTLVFRVTWSEPVINFDVGDLQLTFTGTATAAISSITPVSASVYDVTVIGAGGDGTIRLDRKANSTVNDLATNLVGTGTYTGGQTYTMLLPGSSVWTSSESGVWSNSANWLGGVVANQSGATADFNTIDLSENATITLDSPREIGRLLFGDADLASPAAWTLTDASAGNVLTMSVPAAGSPTIQVNYSGATGESDATIAANSALNPTVIDVPLAGSQGLAKSGKGTALVLRPIAITGNFTSSNSGGYFKLGAGSSFSPTNATVGSSSQLQVAGGTFSTGTFTITNGGSSGLQVHGGTADVTKVTTTGDRDGVLKVTGGTLNVGEVNILRSSNGDITLTNVDSVFQFGFVSQGGTTNIGTFSLASGNSWAFASVEGGDVTISGPATVGGQATSGRGARLRVKDGRLNVLDTTDGLVLSRKNGTNANNIAALYLFGGTATLNKLTLGYDATVTGGYGLVSLEGGALYLGSGGLVKNGTFPTYVNLFAGVLGAKDAWSSSVPMALVATGAPAIHAANEAGEPRDITLSGVLSDWSGPMPAANLQNPGNVAAGGPGGFIKTGAGTLTLAGANTFTGDVQVNEGTLHVSGSLAAGGQLLVNAGGRLTVTGSLYRDITLNGGTVAPGVVGAGMSTGPALIWNGGSSIALNLDTGSDALVLTGALTKGSPGAYAFAVTPGAGFAAGNVYTVATFGSTDFSASDFSATGLPVGFAASFALAGNSLQMTIVGTPFITSPATAAGEFGEPFTYTITAGNVPTSFGAIGLPPGLELDVTTGVISGTPTAAGSFAVTISATNIAGTGSAQLAIEIAKAPATVTLSDLVRSYTGSPLDPTATTEPAGLDVVFTYDGGNPSPTYPGTYAVTATIDDDNYSGSASGTFQIVATATVRHAPNLNGDVDGSVQVLTGENVTLNGGGYVSGDLLMPGTPALRLNGHPTFAGIKDATGAEAPTGYTVTLNGSSVLRHLVRRVDPVSLPVVIAPPQPTGTRYVSINRADQSIGDPSTIRNLTLNGNVGLVALPAGTYGSVIANSGSGFILGEAGATEPAIYNIQNLTLNGHSRVQVVGPVILVLANGTSCNSSQLGDVDHPEWLSVRVAGGGFVLNGSSTMTGSVVAPNGTVTINGQSKLTGRVMADRLSVNGDGVLEDIDNP